MNIQEEVQKYESGFINTLSLGNVKKIQRHFQNSVTESVLMFVKLKKKVPFWVSYYPFIIYGKSSMQFHLQYG